MTTSEVLSIIGAATGGISLVWNVASWRLAGSRISVEVAHGTYRERSGDVVALPIPNTGINVYDVPFGTGNVRPVLIVTIYSKGRLALTLDSLQFVGPGGLTYLPPVPLKGSLPARLDVHSSHTILLPMNLIQVAMHNAMQRTSSSEIRHCAVVRLGNGKTRKSEPFRFFAGPEPHFVDLGGNNNPDDSAALE